MLKAESVPYRYREYTQEPLTEAELRDVFAMLGVRPAALLRRRDPAYASLGLSADSADDVLIAAMAAHPTLLQRPIGVRDGRAVVGRPPEALLALRD